MKLAKRHKPSATRRLLVILSAFVALIVIATGCSSSSSDSGSSSAGYPVTVTSGSGTVTLNSEPKSIVSLSPTATEMLYAIGAGDQVKATDSYSNYPEEAKAKMTSLSGLQPNVEAITQYQPDLVVMSSDSGSVDTIVTQLKALNVPVWVGPAATSLDDVYAQITQLGELTNHKKQADDVVSKMKKDIAAAYKDVKAPANSTYYYELDPTYYSVTSNTFIGAALAPFGLTNIADGSASGSDYPQLNAESIIKANPSMILLADTICCDVNAAAVSARPGWNEIAAVKNNKIVPLNDDIASRWGPRIVELIQQVAAQVKGLK
jgi:iron complex transport system substrate-binding protein